MIPPSVLVPKDTLLNNYRDSNNKQQKHGKSSEVWKLLPALPGVRMGVGKTHENEKAQREGPIQNSD